MSHDLTGKKFGRWVVISFDSITTHYEKLWLCKCLCGNERVVKSGSLKSGKSKSCGCFQREQVNKSLVTHGMTDTHFYRAWVNMKGRCLRHDYYTKKGILVSKEWQKFENFKQDMLKSYKVHVKKFGEVNTTLDRIDGSLGYGVENCRWATRLQQSQNRSNKKISFRGKTLTVKQWADEIGVKYDTLKTRLGTYKWPIEKALTTKDGRS